ncbi:hypothetical protein D3C77_666890 [compost metagenome]
MQLHETRDCLIENRVHYLVVAGALAPLWREEHARESGDLGLQVNARSIEFRLDLIELIGIDLLAHHGAFVVLAEGLLDLTRLIDKVEHEGVILEWMSAIQA